MNDAGSADATTDSAHGAEAAADSAAVAAGGEYADRAGAATDASARSCVTKRCNPTPTLTTPPPSLSLFFNHNRLKFNMNPLLWPAMPCALRRRYPCHAYIVRMR